MKIVIPDKRTVTNGDVSLECFRDFGEVQTYELTDPSEITRRVADADIILCNKTPMNEQTLSLAKSLRYIGLFATGYNNIDLSYTRSRGITVCNAAGYSTMTVVQHVFALILERYSRVTEYSSFVKDGGWTRSEIFSPFVLQTAELYEKTIGIVGYGTIGRAVGKAAAAFGMNVLFYSRTKKNSRDGAKQVSLDNLLAQSDIVTAHCPLNEDSCKMFNADTFAKFKRGAFFINAARGGVVDEPALKAALEDGILSAAAVDVLDAEPMSPECPLIGAPNLTITPHIAWAPTETRKRLVRIVYDNLKAYLSGAPRNVVED